MIGTYWQSSKAARYSLLFALPLLVIYQVLTFVVPPGPGGVDVRNGADILLQAVFVWLAGAWGPRVFMLCLIALGAWLIAKDIRAHPGRLSPAILGGMFIEALFLSLVFGIVVSGLTVALLGAPPQPMMLWLGQERFSRPTMMMLSIGAGLYEELLFRVVLVGLIAWAARRLLGWRPLVAGILATVLGALIFSAFHYIGPFGDRFNVYSFVFRTIAGLFFSALYLTRGFGITAWTHSLYDVFLLLR